MFFLLLIIYLTHIVYYIYHIENKYIYIHVISNINYIQFCIYICIETIYLFHLYHVNNMMRTHIFVIYCILSTISKEYNI
jgi:hypothetical protein